MDEVGVLFDAKEFIETHLWIRSKDIQDGAIVPFRFNECQTDYYHKRTNRDIILKGRQQGFSTEIQGLHFQFAVTTPNVTAATFADEKDQTRRLLQKSHLFLEKIKEEWPDYRVPKTKYSSKNEIYFEGLGSHLYIGTAGEGSGGRADTVNWLHASEFAWWQGDPKALLAALDGSVPLPHQGGRIVIESTPNGKAGRGTAFYDMVSAALAGDSIYTLLFYPWWTYSDNRIPLKHLDKRFADDIDRNGVPVLRYTEEEIALVEKVAHEWGQVLDAEQIAWRRFKKASQGRLFAQEYPEDPLACFLSFEGAVFPDFSAGVHGFNDEDAPKDFDQIVAGIDWGFSSDPFAIGVIGIEKQWTAQETWPLWMLDEFYMTHCHMGDQIRQAKIMMDKWGVEMFLADNSRPMLIAEFNTAGIPTVGVSKTAIRGKNFKQERIQSMENRMLVSEGKTGFRIHRTRCPNAISEFENYVFIPNTTQPIDKDDHMIDLTNYVDRWTKILELFAMENNKETEHDPGESGYPGESRVDGHDVDGDQGCPNVY